MEIVVVALIVLVAAAAIVHPLLLERTAAGRYDTDEEISAEVERYRAAIRANTLCHVCLTANPPQSNYCSQCGRDL